MKSLFLLFLLAACAGYKKSNTDNPFAQYNIHSLSVPMFYNHSAIPNLSSRFTKEIFKTLIDYRKLRLTGDASNSDAVLIGIIDSHAKRNRTIEAENFKSVTNTYGDESIGKRQDFLLPTKQRITLSVRFIIIKKPTKREIELVKSSLGEKGVGGKVIFNQKINITDSFNLKENTGEGIQVLGVQNRGVQYNSASRLAEKAGKSFKDMVLNAF